MAVRGVERTSSFYLSVLRPLLIKLNLLPPSRRWDRGRHINVTPVATIALNRIFSHCPSVRFGSKADIGKILQ